MNDLPEGSPWWAKWMVAEWRDAWKWLSVQWPIACAFVCEIYAQYPEQINEAIANAVPATWRPHLLSVVFLFGAFLRIKRQPKVSP